MLVLRFTANFRHPTRPLKLRFASQEPLPELPLVPNLVAAYSTNWQQEKLQQQLMIFAFNRNDITSPVSTSWLTSDDYCQLSYVAWCAAPLANAAIKATWAATEQLTGWVNSNWLQSQLTGYQNMTPWLHCQLSIFDTTLTWQSIAAVVRLFHTDWTSKAVTLAAFGVTWPAVNTHNITYQLIYGPRPAAVVCTRSHQPTRRLRFDGVKKADKWPLKPRFVQPDLYCVIDPGGNLLQPMPELPTNDGQTPISPPVRKSYMMTPELRCHRLDGQEINIISASWSASRSQWGASVNLICGSKGDQDLLFADGPQLFKLQFNGFEFYCLAEEPSMDHRFGQTRYTVTGRSSIAQLASPHSAIKSASNAASRSLAALITDELAGSGWSLQFDMQNFNVPAGAFNYLNQTPIEAISKLVSAIGGMMYADGALKKLIVRPLWPAKPWAFDDAVVDIAVHDSVILAISQSPAVSPGYNAVFVRGEQQGVECRIRQTGSAGDKLAPDVVDALITDAQAARQRGTAVLAESGTKQRINLTLPIMPDGTLPPVLPGTLLGITWQTSSVKTLVDSISITGTKSADGRLTIRQQIGALKP